MARSVTKRSEEALNDLSERSGFLQANSRPIDDSVSLHLEEARLESDGFCEPWRSAWGDVAQIEPTLAALVDWNLRFGHFERKETAAFDTPGQQDRMMNGAKAAEIQRPMQTNIWSI